MLFGSRLESEIYQPWKEYYINYNHLKKLLKEGVILKNSWTDKDEQNFVSALDKDLEKVYTFQGDKYESLNEQLDKLQQETENPGSGFDVNSFTTRLEEVLDTAQQLDHFQRLNYTGFIKIVKKHDRIHPEFSVKPLLNVRLKNLPFHSEDYSPLLYKVSALFQFLRDNYDIDQTTSKLSSFTEDSQQEYQSFKFWVHPDNLMEVKATILRHLPVLVYDSKQGVDDLIFEGDEETSDPTITCLYFDSPNFELYNDKLTKAPNSCSLRLKWIGKLGDNPKVTIEKKTFDPTSENFNVNDKLSLKQKYLDSFVSGHFNTKKLSKGLIKAGSDTDSIQRFTDEVSTLSDFIRTHHLQPCVRVVYKRTAFQIPGDNNIRIVIDSDLLFIREDSFDEQRPIRDPTKWHRTDIDSKINNPYSLLRKGEYSRFPYSVMEIRIKRSKNKRGLVWIDDLVNSHLVKEIPNFSKFIQGVASLFLEDDKLGNIPLWFNELESDIKVDPEEAYLNNKKKMLKQQNDDENMSKFRSMLANSTTGGFSPRSKSFSGSIINGSFDLNDNSKQSNASNDSKLLTHDQILEEDEGDDTDSEFENTSAPRRKLLRFPSNFDLSKLIDADSEEEEIDLPAGVVKPESYIKNAGPIKVEPKVWLANERTFNRWLHVATLLSTLTFIIYSSSQKAHFPQLANLLAYLYFVLTVFSAIWGYYIFSRRRLIILERSGKHLDNVVGPLLIALGLIFGLVINFVFGFRAVAASMEQFDDFAISPATREFYTKNSFHGKVLAFVFNIVRA